MIMRPGLRKFVLVLHLTASVGWIGAVLAYLALVVAAMTTRQAQTVRAAWFAMELTIRFAIVPLALASLLTGLIMSLGTQWGLFRHYWVVFSLVLTVLATVVLLDHVSTVSRYAGAAATAGVAEIGESGAATVHASRAPAQPQHDRTLDPVNGLQGELLHAGGGLLVLLAVQVLNVYKPRGLTPYGWRREQADRRKRLANASPPALDASG